MTALLLRAVAVFSAVLAIVGVGLAPGAGPKPKPAIVVSVRLSETGIALSRTSVPAGRVLFSVQNRSPYRRAFEVVGAARTRLLGPGGKTSVVVRFAKVGRRDLRSAGAPGKPLPTLTRSLRVAPATKPSPVPKLVLTLIQSGLGSPTHVVAPPGDESRLLVVQQNGLVSLIENGALRADPFLDLRSVVRAEGEKGLLSIAFAPDYAASGLLYAYFNNRDGNIRVVEYRRSVSDQDLVDRSTRRVLLALVKPTADHNGGMMQFGPDGYLYIAIGDGGANPPTIPVGATGQTLDDLFGSILRIDPRHGSPYAIPPGNPFVSVAGARPEIVAYGLRNPWRFWIDAKKNQMLIGDVGEGTREEIDRLPLATARPRLRLAVQGGERDAPRGFAPGRLQVGHVDPAAVAVPAFGHPLLDHRRRRQSRSTSTRARRPLSLVGLLRRPGLCSRSRRCQTGRDPAPHQNDPADELRDRRRRPHLPHDRRRLALPHRPGSVTALPSARRGG